MRCLTLNRFGGGVTAIVLAILVGLSVECWPGTEWLTITKGRIARLSLTLGTIQFFGH
jgi:hypothetical protein